MGFVTSTWIAWLLVLLAGVNSCIGNLMLKQSRLKVMDHGLFALLTSPWFIGGLTFYGINVILFAKALEKLPVSAAYPVLAGSGFSLLTFSAWWLFKERLMLHQYIGLAAILFGIFLLAKS